MNTEAEQQWINGLKELKIILGREVFPDTLNDDPVSIMDQLVGKMLDSVSGSIDKPNEFEQAFCELRDFGGGTGNGPRAKMAKQLFREEVAPCLGQCPHNMFTKPSNMVGSGMNFVAQPLGGGVSPLGRGL